MERSTVIGKEWSERVSRHLAGRRPILRGSRGTSPRAAGFTLLELMIVMFVLVILVAVALPQYQRSIVHAREAVLRDDLYKIRTLLDQYAADKGKLPSSLDDLVSAGYIREIPIDPMTDERTWNIVTGDDPNSTEGEQGVIDIHSLSTDTSTEGTPYSDW